MKIKNLIFLSLLFICSSQLGHAKKNPSTKFNYDETYFNKDGSCKPFPEEISFKEYSLSKACGEVKVNIGFKKYDGNKFDIIFCVPQMNPNPVMKRPSPLHATYASINVTIKSNKISDYTKPIRHGRMKSAIITEKGSNFVSLNTLGESNSFKLIPLDSSSPDQYANSCDIRIDNLGLPQMTISGGGKPLSGALNFLSKDIKNSLKQDSFQTK